MRDRIEAWFYLPNLVGLRYVYQDGREACFVGALHPISTSETWVLAWASLPKLALPNWLLETLARLFFTRILNQDKAILETVSLNQKQFPDQFIRSTRLDFVRQPISALIKDPQRSFGRTWSEEIIV